MSNPYHDPDTDAYVMVPARWFRRNNGGPSAIIGVVGIVVLVGLIGITQRIWHRYAPQKEPVAPPWEQEANRKANEMRIAAARKPRVEEFPDAVTLGSSRAHVLEIMGNPASSGILENRETLYYGPSSRSEIDLSDGIVTGWSDKGYDLKLRLHGDDRPMATAADAASATPVEGP